MTVLSFIFFQIHIKVCMFHSCSVGNLIEMNFILLPCIALSVKSKQYLFFILRGNKSESTKKKKKIFLLVQLVDASTEIRFQILEEWNVPL